MQAGVRLAAMRTEEVAGGREAVRADPRQSSRRATVFAALTAALIAWSIILTGCAQDPNQTAATQNKAKLDQEIQHARSLGIPASLLQPVLSQEQAIAGGVGGVNYSYKDASNNYALLYTQVLGIEQTAAQTLKQQAQTDLQAFSAALESERNAGFSEASAYQNRLSQAYQDFSNAQTVADFARCGYRGARQTEALNSLGPAYQKLQAFASAIQAVHTAGFNSSNAQVEYSADLAIFDNGATAARFQTLVDVIDGQINQLLADQTEAMPYIASALLQTYQSRIDDLIRFGVNTTGYQAQYTADVSTLASAKTLADYLTFGQAINGQSNAMTLDYVRGKARYDLRELQRLINQTQASSPLLAYEYATYEGIGIATDAVNSAAGVSGYEVADAQVLIQTSNLRALLDNLNDSTGPGTAHQTDLQLMQQYGILSGRVIVVSLREQVSRVYQNGKLVYWSYVTTGRPEAPTPPGLHYVIDKEYHTEFVSGDPPARRSGTRRRRSTMACASLTAATSCTTPGGATSSAPAPICRTTIRSPSTAARTAASTIPRTTCSGSTTLRRSATRS